MPYAHLGALRCHYLDQGSGPVLLLLHGLGSSARDWEKQMHAFSARFRVIAPDLRGFGASSRMGPYSIEQFAADAWGLLDQLGIERFHLLGYSMGGAVALQMALAQPARVARLIISNSVPSFRPRSRVHWLMLCFRLVTMSLLGPRVLARLSMKHMFPKPEQRELREINTRRAARTGRWVYLASLAALTKWSVVDHLSELTKPTLVLAAEHDYFSREDILQFAHALPRGRLQIFPDTHHGLPQEEPADYNEAVLDFLTRVRA